MIIRGANRPGSPYIGNMRMWQLVQSPFCSVYSVPLREDKSGQRKVRSPDELEKQTGLGRFDRSGNDAAYIRATPRKHHARCRCGAISPDRWSLGDIRFALREAEIARSDTKVINLRRGAAARVPEEFFLPPPNNFISLPRKIRLSSTRDDYAASFRASRRHRL